MGINFPNAPVNGQVYPVTPTPGLPQYVWDATSSAWVLKSDGLGPTIYVSDTAPAGAIDGALWWCSADGVLYLRFNDGDSTAWVQCTPSASDLSGFVRFDNAQALTGTQQAQARDNIGVQKKNYIVNGAMQISQDNGATAGNASGIGFFPVDMFAAITNATSGVASVQWIASTTPGGSPNRFRITVTTADTAVAAADLVWISQKIEGQRCADLRFGSASAKTVTLRFGVKAPAGIYCVTLVNLDVNRSYVAEYVIAAGEANTDVIKTLTIAGDVIGTWRPDNVIGIDVRWSLMTGATYQQAAGAWGTVNAVGSPNQFNFMGTNGNVFELFDVGLYEGPSAPPFVVPDYVSEMQLCRRYFLYWDRIVYLANVIGKYPSYVFPVAMRIAPAVTILPDGGTGAVFTIATTGMYQNANHTSDAAGAIKCSARM